MTPDASAFERHYRAGQLAELWGLGRETVRLLVKDERGVVKIRHGRRRAQTTYYIPESVVVPDPHAPDPGNEHAIRATPLKELHRQGTHYPPWGRCSRIRINLRG